MIPVNRIYISAELRGVNRLCLVEMEPAVHGLEASTLALQHRHIIAQAKKSWASKGNAVGSSNEATQKHAIQNSIGC